MSQEANISRAKKRPAKQVKGDWPDDRIRKLIAAVKLRPGLYNIAIRTFGSEKDQMWKEVAGELGNADDWIDCRAKWQGLRVTFKVNLATLRRHPFESIKIHWRFFEAMRFVDLTEGQTLTDATSNLDLNDEHNLEPTKPVELNEGNLPLPSSFPSSSDQRRKKATTNIVKDPPLGSSKNSDLKKMAEKAIQLCSQRDTYTIFGEYIANELRELPLSESLQLRRRINRTVVAFFDERDVKQQQYRLDDEVGFQPKADVDELESDFRIAVTNREEDTLYTEPEDNAMHQSDVNVCDIKLEDTGIQEQDMNLETISAVKLNESISPILETNSVSTMSSDLHAESDTIPASEWELPSNFTKSTNGTCPPTKSTSTILRNALTTDTKSNSTTKRAYPFTILEQSVTKLQKTIDHHKEIDDDEFDLFGKSIAVQLKRMPLERALICQENLQKVMNQERLLQR